MGSNLVFKVCKFKDDLYSLYGNEPASTIMFCQENDALYMRNNKQWVMYSNNYSLYNDSYTANTFLAYDTPAKDATDEEMIIL